MTLDNNLVNQENREENRLFSDYYAIKPPFGNSGIYTNEDTGSMEYNIFEPFLGPEEQELLNKIKTVIIDKADIPYDVIQDDKKVEEHLKNIIQKEFKPYEKKIPHETREKIEYFILRDFLGYGKIDLLIHDEKIEDISCNGLNIPIYVWHRDYESIPTNIVFKSENELRSIIIRLAYKAGVQISISNPIIEGTLPNGYRIHLTLSQVSTRGHTFTIRKLRKNPYTLIDLIKLGTISPKLGAYLWCLVENERSIMVSGSTGSGKTTLLNSICTFIKPEHKVVTIEDVRELNLHQNWIPMVTRTSFQPDLRDITLFDLLKSALRQRPDFIVLGEVRGEEAYTLFQAIATGHGGICSIHSDSVESTIKRLGSRPLNIPNHIIPLMNVIVQIRRIVDGENVVRKVTEVAEIVGNKPDGTPILKKRVSWNHESRSFEFIMPNKDDNYLLMKISEFNHIPPEELVEELERKQLILEWMVKAGIRSHDEVAEVVRSYYLNPDEIYQRARVEI
jgi:flagellar protein FlaI